ncbi:MAG: hypothetical protein RL254_861 [Planctomycetota bacterium]|jgi:hypothetical protein
MAISENYRIESIWRKVGLLGGTARTCQHQADGHAAPSVGLRGVDER